MFTIYEIKQIKLSYFYIFVPFLQQGCGFDSMRIKTHPCLRNIDSEEANRLTRLSPVSQRIRSGTFMADEDSEHHIHSFYTSSDILVAITEVEEFFSR